MTGDTCPGYFRRSVPRLGDLTFTRRVLRMNLLCLFAVFIPGVFSGDMGVSPAEAAMRRIIGLGHSTEDPDVQWLMKQTDLLLIVVSSPHWRATVEERQNLINVIERFVSEAISGPLGVDIRDAAAVFEGYSIGFHSFNRDDERYISRGLSEFALSLAQALANNAPGLPSLLSDPDFPLDAHRRMLLASIASIKRRLTGSPPWSFLGHIYKSHVTGIPSPIEYLEMVLDVYTKVEDRYTQLCQETGVDVQHTYRPMKYLRNSWGYDIEEGTRLIHSVILPMIDDARTIEFATTVGRCLDFAMRHHSVALSIHSLDDLARYFFARHSDLDPQTICDQLMTKGFARDQDGSLIPAPLVDDGRPVLTDFSDANPPIPMEFADALTIRVTRLVEVVALEVPEIREVFGMIDGPTSMSKFELILWAHLNPLKLGDAGIGHLVYYLARLLRIPILQLPMMRETYFNSLSLEQFEKFKRILSCMARLEPLVGREGALAHIHHALQHPDQIDLMSRGLQALTRLYKKFQQDPLRSGSMSRQRTVVGFLPAYLVFDRSDDSRGDFNAQKFRAGLEWVIGHELAVTSPASLTRLVAGDLFRLEQPMGIVLEFLGGGAFNDFDEMVFALDRIFREPVAHNMIHTDYRLSKTIGRLGFDAPKRIFAAVMKLGGLGALEAPLRAQVLRIVPVLIKWMRAILNGPRTMEYSSRSSPLWRILADLKPNDHAKLKNVLDDQEQVIPPLPTNPPPRFSFLGTPPPI